MKWLLWKEYRIHRLILIVAAVLLVVPHLVALILVWFRIGIGPGSWGQADGGPLLATNLVGSAFQSVMGSQFAMALLGGNAIAGERVDRSAEFLAYLPVSRVRIVLSKLILPLATAAVILVPNLIIMALAGAALPEDLRRGAAWYAPCGPALVGIMFFSIGWLLSSMLESPVFAILGGLVTPWLILAAFGLFAEVSGFPKNIMALSYLGTCILLTPACFVAGTWYYLRRVEP